MMNLNNQEKKLFFKICLILIGAGIIISSYLGISTIIKRFVEKNEDVKKELIHKFESRIDSINVVNYMLMKQADSLEAQIKLAQKSKEIVYIETIKKEKEIKNATATEHAKAIDSLTNQSPTWTIVKDSLIKDTIINYRFTKSGVTNLRLTVNDLYKYKRLYTIDEDIIFKQSSEISLQKTIITNSALAIKDGEKALAISSEINKKLEKQLNKAQNRAKKWPYWLGAGVIGGVAVCLSIK